MKKLLNNIKDRINDVIVFSNSFAFAKRDLDGAGITFENEQVLFPADHLGSYFYVRSSGIYSVVKNDRVKTGASVIFYLDGLDANAVYKKTLQAFRTCNGNYQGVIYTVSRIVFDNFLIIREEVPMFFIQKALKGLRNDITLLKMDLDITATMELSRCEIPDCKTC